MRIKTILLVLATVLIGLPIAVLLVSVAIINWQDRSNGILESSGVSREFLLHVPDSYDGSQAVPLVISFHAGATWPAQHRNMTGWARLADRHGFIAVFPAGVAEMAILDVPRIWPVDRTAARERDIRFIADLIEHLEGRFNIDRSRIFADGMSNGGAMAFVLSCAMPDRIAAIGLVASAQSRPFDWCPDRQPVPMVAFHGRDDPVVPFAGGALGDPFNPVRPIYPPIRTFVSQWAERNRCHPEPVVVAVSATLERMTYQNCDTRGQVEFYAIAGAGHVWPGGKPLPEWRVGPNTSAIDATETMWAFYRRNPLRE